MYKYIKSATDADAALQEKLDYINSREFLDEFDSRLTELEHKYEHDLKPKFNHKIKFFITDGKLCMRTPGEISGYIYDCRWYFIFSSNENADFSEFEWYYGVGGGAYETFEDRLVPGVWYEWVAPKITPETIIRAAKNLCEGYIEGVDKGFARVKEYFDTDFDDRLEEENIPFDHVLPTW